jgi:hypothetical protein
MFTSRPETPKALIARHRLALKVVVAQLVARLAVYQGLDTLRLPRVVHAALLQILRPAESALRRLIVIAARGLVPKASRPRPPIERGLAKTSGVLQPSQISFQLFDPTERAHPGWRKRKVKLPRLLVIDPDPPFAPPMIRPVPAAGPTLIAQQISALRMCRRLRAITSALDSIPRQAQRLARWRLRRPEKVPLRSGRPPGFRKKALYQVDFILGSCDDYVRRAVAHDTS